MGRPPKNMEWFQLQNRFYEDEKLEWVTEQPKMGNEAERVWVRLMCMASQRGHGVIDVCDGTAVGLPKLAEKCKVTTEFMEEFLGHCRKMGMITENDYLGIVLVNWDKHQADRYRLMDRNADAAEKARVKTAKELVEVKALKAAGVIPEKIKGKAKLKEYMQTTGGVAKNTFTITVDDTNYETREALVRAVAEHAVILDAGGKRVAGTPDMSKIEYMDFERPIEKSWGEIDMEQEEAEMARLRG